MLRLLKLGLRRFRSPEDYRKMQSYIAEKSIGELKAKGLKFSLASVLELGAGRGGYSVVLNRESRCFLASDVKKDPWVEQLNIPFTFVDVSKRFPFESKTFDVIYCSSLIEHVSNPDNLLQESWRVLKPGGILYLSFPPFFSLALVGGHQFKPFHFLGERLSVRLTNLVRGSNYTNYGAAYGNFGLYPLKIEDVKNRLLAQDFRVLDIFARMIPFNTARLPGPLKDLLTWHVCYLAQRSDDS